ncbi:DUF2726 domain-containing protein [Nitrosomonas supralitoralis]|uniref:DUF2726 domain-containing protein n=1 Tax=Nitrosomonas supralitoralis TaxID=2116706 RepID=A0A2P7NV45_9PROT|nr:DUF2726 domain-containing protein [Nitrosomonas supralitoralis]PSJ17309.1 hypothetical protein C7H79_08980 [Nitrosomonas supralitoralis]
MNIITIIIKTITSFKFHSKSRHSKYESLEEILSSTEYSFFVALKESLSKDYEIFAKVRINDVLTPDEIFTIQNSNAAIYRIPPKHFDYILCEKRTLSVIAVIVLDDRNHIRREARAKSSYVEKACVTAGFKLLRFPSRSNYCSKAVRDVILNSLNTPT